MTSGRIAQQAEWTATAEALKRIHAWCVGRVSRLHGLGGGKRVVDNEGPVIEGLTGLHSNFHIYQSHPGTWAGLLLSRRVT